MRLFNILLGLVAVLWANDVCAYAAEVEQHETIHKTFAGAKSIEVDNVNGGIQVMAWNGPGIQADIEKTLRADDSDRAETARKEVKLDISEEKEAVTQES